MPIQIGQIEFGEIDAKNEVLEQEKYGSSVFRNGFVIPPGIDDQKLLRGAKCFIYGQKGCGKTALLLHIRQLLEESGAKTKTILFKSGITERERQKIAGTNFTLVETEGSVRAEYDYQINWLWYIYRNLLRLIDENQVFKNWDVVASLKILLGVTGEINTGVLSDLSTKRIKGFAKAGLSAGPLTLEIAAEVEALQKDRENSEIDIIDIVEKYLPEVVFHPRHRSVLIFDELELFWNRSDQKERDLFMIRDLLYAVSRVNRSIGAKNVSLSVLASVRSEVLDEVNRVGPEISRDVRDRGVRVHWNVKSDSPSQPILDIIERKIYASELEADEIPSDDIWILYFPKRVFGRQIKQYLLDISMFKPRNIVSLLNEIKNCAPDESRISESTIQMAQSEFSKKTWIEVEDGLLGEFGSDFVRLIKLTLMAFKPEFSVDDFCSRMDVVSRNYPKVNEVSLDRTKKLQALEALYRCGAIGNRYFVRESGKNILRNHWIFRDYYEPLLDKPFQVHESIRKELQLSFRSS